MKRTRLKQRIGNLFILGAMLLAMPLEVFANTPAFPFTDVPQNHWARSYVEFVHVNHIMNGITNTNFAPNTNLSRAMAVTMLFRTHHGRIANANDARTNPFTDVSTEHWAAPYITWAHANDIVDGIGNNRFAPNDYLSREQFAVMLHRFAAGEDIDTGVPTTFNLNRFTDRLQISSWAVDAMRWANYKEILSGTSQTTIAPHAVATRAQGAALLYRFSNNV